MKIQLDYGERGLWVTLPDKLDIEVIQAPSRLGLLDEQAAILEAMRKPIGLISAETTSEAEGQCSDRV